MKDQNSTMFHQKTILLSFLFMVIAMPSWAQIEISGKITNSEGKGIGFVSVGVINDTIGVISDKNGYYKLFVPDKHHDLTFSHVSYNNFVLPYSVYSKNKVNNVSMKEKTVELSTVNVVYGKKTKTISGMGLKLPGALVASGKKSSYETGAIITVGKNYVAERIRIPVLGNTYEQCTVSVKIYNIDNKNVFKCIQNRPLYIPMKKCGKTTLDITLEEKIILEKGHRYCIGIAIINPTTNGQFVLPAYLKSGYVGNYVMGRRKKIPASAGIKVEGREICDKPASP